jgi:hypothetical protein
MAPPRFDLLPKELIAHVVSFCNATSAINLAQTCKLIQAACDGLVFKEILIASQKDNYTPTPGRPGLDIITINSQALNDPTIWIRYALADEIAWHLSSQDPETSLSNLQDWINFAPELSVVKHPLIYQDCWAKSTTSIHDQKPCELFCYLMALLADTSDAELSGPYLNMIKDSTHFTPGSRTAQAFLQALGSMATTIRQTVRTRLRAWPYNDSARIPYVSPPQAWQIPLRPLNDTYTLPLPFTRKAIDLLGRSTTSFSSWDSWYAQHNHAAWSSDDYLSSGTWTGYYMHFRSPAQSLDPPMTDMRLETVYKEVDSLTWAVESKHVRVENGVDSVGEFTFDGVFTATAEREIKLRGRKQYKHRTTGWEWDCRLTPFGIVGYWGRPGQNSETIRRMGMLWLWKTEWTEEEAGPST